MDRASVQERFGIIGSSPSLRHALDRVRLIAGTDITVLIQGESGVGKDLFAEAIHQLSARRHKPILNVNCAAIPEGLIESELFGNEKGAYTGAVERRTGYFEEANGSTIFLDEIGEMPLTAQVRLLRVLETGEFSRVGSSAVLKSDVRIIVATNKDLAREVARGRFREDLYYRISTVILQIPPLRDRKEDILPIFSSFQHRFTQKYNSTLKRLDDSARELLQNYRWPGNARELRNVAEQMVVLNKSDVITVDDIRSYLRGTIASGPELGLMPVPHETMGDGADSRERELIYRTLLELRTEIHWLKEKIIEMTGRPKASWEGSSEAEPSRYMIVRDENSDPVPSLIEDAAFEIEGAGAPEGGVEDHVSKAAENGELPTLEAAERKLIEEALERFNGNRRQTAQALGISERTLYRKIKEFEGEDA
ncbi:MAG: sigma-54-dependent Fis family transcriptional regulator [Bacteroidetes bacterium]|nr:sigma-54-dependent Fis family transcriptional regulator [Bacteroidota bacterium]